jgi:hypothetical protein
VDPINNTFPFIIFKISEINDMAIKHAIRR